MNSDSVRNKHEYYEYHKDFSHETNFCWQLKKQIDLAIQSRNMSHMIKDIRTTTGGVQNTQDKKNQLEI